MTDSTSQLFLSKQYAKNYKFLLYFGLILLFIAELLNYGGIMPLVVFISYGVLFVGLTKKASDILYWIVAVFPNMSLLEGSFGVISIRRVVLTIGIILLLFIRKNTKGKLVPGWFFAIWFAYICFNIIFISDRGFSSILVLSIFFLIAYLSEAITQNNIRESEKFIIALTTGLIFVLVIGYLELFLGQTFFMSLWTGAERYRYGIIRVGSTVADSNNVCFTVFPLAFLFRIKVYRKWYSKRISNVLLILSNLLIVLTMSRTGIIALAISLFSSFVLTRKAYFTLAAPIVGVSVNTIYSYISAFMGQEQFQSSNRYRDLVRAQAMLMWNDHKLFGVGSLSFLYDLEQTDSLNVMNTYVFCLVNYGIIGLIFYLGYWWLIIRKEIYEWIHNRSLNEKSLIKIVIIIGLLIISYSLDTFNFGLIWLIGAYYMAIDCISDNCRMEKFQ